MIYESPLLRRVMGGGGVPVVSSFIKHIEKYRAMAYPKNLFALYRGLLKFPTGWFYFQDIGFCFTGWKQAPDNLDTTAQMLAKVVLQKSATAAGLSSLSYTPDRDRLFCCPIGGSVFTYRRGDEFPHVPAPKHLRWFWAGVALVKVYRAAKELK